MTDDAARPDDVPVAETRAIWERLAPWWDAAVGEGNDFQRQLIIPATDRLLDPRPGQAILDVACGNGNYARHLARRGVDVVACDFAAAFVDRARARGAAAADAAADADAAAADAAADADDAVSARPIEYLVGDATDEAALLALGAGRFDAAVCSMAMMDMPTIDPLLRAARRLLKPGGRFVFSLPHPCFNSNRSRVFAELENEGGRLRQVYGVRITEYARAGVDRSAGILNQPEPHYLFHRPLNDVFAACFRAGFVIDGFEEPTYPEGHGAKSAFAWAKRPQIPPAVVIRCRPT